jgi:CHAT domain-containing protein
MLRFDELAAQLSGTGARSVVLVPYRALHILPLHLLPCDGSEYLCDAYDVSYAPSARVLELVAARPPRGRRRAVIAHNPDATLPFSDLEAALLAELLPAAQTLPGEACTWDAVQQAMPDAELFHYSGHAFFHVDNPLASSLELAGRRLTAGEIMAGSDLSSSTLATLSACETGQVSYRQGGDEYTGLPAAMLLAGAPTVLVTQWVVEDSVGPVFMRSFYERLVAREESPGEAFAGAVGDTRAATADELLERFGDPHDPSPALARLLLFCRSQRDRSASVFAHPEYWGAYMLAGRT